MKSYKDFMKIRKEIQKFSDVVSDAVEELGLNGSYTHNRNREEQPDADFLEIHAIVLRKYTDEQILDLITKIGGKEEFIDAVEEVSVIDNLGKDVYYYFLTKSNKVKIGAYHDLDTAPWEYEADPYIKYRYGDHHSNYGILLIEQNYGTVEHFLETMPKQFVYYLFSSSGLAYTLKKEFDANKEDMIKIWKCEVPEIKINKNELEIDFTGIYKNYIDEEHYFGDYAESVCNCLEEADSDYEDYIDYDTFIYKRKFE